MSGDDPRARILARRARFLAAALASAGLAGTALMPAALEGCGGSDEGAGDASTEQPPQPCLTPVRPDDAGDDAAPQPCLSPLPPDAGEDDGGPREAGPQPCLRADPAPDEE